MTLPDPQVFLTQLDYDSVSALVLIAVSVGSADGKLGTAELGRAAEVVEAFLGGALSNDELWPLVFAAFNIVGSDGPEVAIASAEPHFGLYGFGDAAVALAAAVGAATSGINTKEGLLIRSVAQKCGVQVDSQHYFQLLADGQALGKN